MSCFRKQHSASSDLGLAAIPVIFENGVVTPVFINKQRITGALTLCDVYFTMLQCMYIWKWLQTF